MTDEEWIDLFKNVNTDEVPVYDEREVYTNCTVEVLRNSKTGEESIGWWKND